MRTKTLLSLAAASGACALLSGCLNPQTHMQRDYGWAVKTNIVAQIANPEARYAREIEPASNGDRAATANDRYEKGQVTEPSSISTR